MSPEKVVMKYAINLACEAAHAAARAPYLTFGIGFVAAMAYGLVKLYAMLQAAGLGG